MRARSVALAMLVMAIAACASGPASQTPVTSSPRPTPTPVVPGPSPTPSTLHAGGFARIVVDVLHVRTGPSTSAPQLVLISDGGDAGTFDEAINLGTQNDLTKVFLIEGPEAADGLIWWRVNPTVGFGPDMLHTPSRITGWIAQGDSDGDWVVPEDPCPARPVEVKSLIATAANWAIGMGCFSGELLNLRGWYAGQPEGWSDGTCDLEPAFLCHSASIFPVERGWGPGNEHRLDFYLHPAISVMPAAGQWLQVTGMFDAPIARTCPPEQDSGNLACRHLFVASHVRAARD